ncbi:MAG TPA: rhodanese-like domain-containing protein, partial [Agitococcus sp.]|nr:rhodanese-like domain-containing protein [Agitococcus sp.]
MADLPLLLDAQQLLDNLHHRELLIVDLCKKSVYQQAHIPNAVWVNTRDLVSGELPATGRLPSVEQLQQLFANIGLTANKHLVVYDDEGGAWAGRFIWTLDIIGHKNYSYLNGGLHAWLAAGFAIDNSPTTPTPSSPSIDFNDQPQALLADVLAHYQDS